MSSDSRPATCLLSRSYSDAMGPSFDGVTALGVRISETRRPSDWALGRYRRLLGKMRSALQFLRDARRFDYGVLATPGLETTVVGALKSWVCPRTRISVFDPLFPTAKVFDRIYRVAYRRLDRFAPIRTGDIATLSDRFGVPVDRCALAPFPAGAFDEASAMPKSDDGYLYAAGFANRDYDTLLHAVAGQGWPAIISCNATPVAPFDAKQVNLLPALSPADGRRRAAAARIVVVPLKNPHVQCGPTMFLDAMAMAKPIVATRANGTADYLTDGVDALLVPPGDVAALRNAIARLWNDPSLCRRLGSAARARAATLTRLSTLEAILAPLVGSTKDPRHV